MKLPQLPLGARKRVAYVAEFLRDPRRISAITRTNDTVLTKVAALLPPEISRMVNVGAGTGDLEKILLRRDQVAQGGKIVSVEPSKWFAPLIPEVTGGDRRVKVINALLHQAMQEITDEFGGERAQVITTSVPISIFTPEQQHEFITMMSELLERDGECLVYIFRDVSEALRKVFPRVDVQKTKGQWIPPWAYTLHRAWKTAPAGIADNMQDHSGSAKQAHVLGQMQP